MIAPLLAAFRTAGIDATPLELAEVLWLTAHWPQTHKLTQREKPPEEPLAKPKDEGEASGGEERGEEGEADTPGPPPDGGASTSPDRRAYLPSAGGTAGGAAGAGFRSPGARALPGTLGLARSLRPLMRRLPSKQRWIFDEHATAERVAEQGLWLPVLRPASERWLRVDVIVDTSPSMRVWQPTLDELQLLLRQHGAFRDVRSWQLSFAGSGGPFLSAAPGLPPHDPRELLDPEGRRLILVLSDCVADAWYGGPLRDLLAGWGRSQPVVLVHMLPERLWGQTGLAAARLFRVRGPQPGSANARLVKLPLGPRWLKGPPEKEEVPLPLVTLEPGLLSRWARVLAGDGEAKVPAVLLGKAPPPRFEAKAPEELTAEQRVRAFQANASALAFRLACLFAAAPLRLPVMRLVQRTLLPESRQQHLAEVFLGGLLRRLGPADPEAPPDLIDYDFLPGVRDLLFAAGFMPDAVQVQRVLSQYVAEHFGSALDFQAILENPEAAGDFQIDEATEPFARVAAEVLGWLGGRYAAAAERLSAGGGGLGADSTTTPSKRSSLFASPHHALTHLTRITQSLEPEEGRRWLHEFLRYGDNIEETVEAALQVAVETGDPIGQILAGHVSEMSPRLVEKIALFCEQDSYRHSVPLREIALAVTERHLEALRKSWAGPEGAHQAELAKWTQALPRRLTDVGRLEEALAAAREAVRLCRQLAVEDAHEFQSGLTSSMMELSRALRMVGANEEALSTAQEATSLARQTASTHDQGNQLLARALNQQTRALTRSGRYAEALATALEAAEISRQLVKQQADSAPPILGGSLDSLSEALHHLNRTEEAFNVATEAVTRHRELAMERPDAFLSKLAASLTNFGAVARSVGRLEEALAASRESTEICRKLAAVRPAAFRPDLASSLTNLGNLLVETGKPEEALATLQEAVALHRSLAERHPAAYHLELATGLHNLGLALDAVGRHEEALAATQEALELQSKSVSKPALGPTPLRLPEFAWQPEVSPAGALLQVAYGVVPFHGREQEMEDLLAWCNEGAPVQVRLYTGPGGIGKTRLALELCRRMRDDGWQAGLLAPDPERSPADVWRDLEARALPTLIVVDYAESQREILVPLFRQLYRLDEGKFRVLLLARDALDWWEHLKRESEGVGELLSGPATRWFMLTALAKSKKVREDSYRLAADAFSKRLGKPAPEEVPKGLEERFYERVLLLHMRALADVEGAGLEDRDDILDYILGKERRFWKRLANARGLPEPLAAGVGQAMAAINLGGGAENEAHAVRVLSALPFFADQDHATLVQVARLLHDSYPGEKWIEPLVPDLLGEHLTRRELEGTKGDLLRFITKQGQRDSGSE